MSSLPTLCVLNVMLVIASLPGATEVIIVIFNVSKFVYYYIYSSNKFRYKSQMIKFFLGEHFAERNGMI